MTSNKGGRYSEGGPHATRLFQPYHPPGEVDVEEATSIDRSLGENAPDNIPTNVAEYDEYNDDKEGAKSPPRHQCQRQALPHRSGL